MTTTAMAQRPSSPPSTSPPAGGGVIGRCYPKPPAPQAMEFRKFLDQIEANVPADLDVHLVMDNYA